LPTDNPNINGVEFDHSSCRFRIDGTVEARVKEITYGASVDGAQQIHGTSFQPIGETRGQYNPKEVTLTLYRAAWDALVDRFGTSLLKKRFLITVERSEDGQPFRKDSIVGCRIKDHEDSSSEGGEAAVVKIAMTCFYVLPNGLKPTPTFKL
jgi:hypothetical protein